MKRFIYSILLFFLLACAAKNSIFTLHGEKQSLQAYEQLIKNARDLIHERNHKKALKVLDQAAQINPMDPQWPYERARTLFAMDRFEESAAACNRALAMDPGCYDALSLGWAARIEADHGAATTTQAVRQEIELLLHTSGRLADALMAAVQGYVCLAGLANLKSHRLAWSDFNQDGFVGLLVDGHRLFQNTGQGNFMEITEATGLGTYTSCNGGGWGDYDNDRHPDIFAFDHPGNHLLKNSGTGFFVNMTPIAFSPQPAMQTESAAWGDLDNDKFLDLFITNLAHPRYIKFSDLNMMLMNQEPPDYHYTDRFKHSGMGFEETNSDPAFADVDNDGDMDIYITSIYPGRYSHLYLNDGNGFFTDATWLSGTRVENAWGAAFADFNNDGYIDLAVAGENGEAAIRMSPV